MQKTLHFRNFSLVLVLISTLPSVAQMAKPSRMFRFYEDNDFLNVRGLGTDKSYTNGVRLDLFYGKRKPPRIMILPHAGNESNDTYGWSVMQIMITPKDISIPAYQPNDYPYSGALFVTHSLYSYNKDKKYSFQTELIAGIRGPASFAEQTQKLIHRTIHDRKPMGWQNQTTSKILLNINFTAEKQLAAFKGFAELLGGAKMSAGSMMNSLTVYPLIRLGKMNPYFNGFLSQFGRANGSVHQMQFYVFIKPRLTLTASNAIFHGRIRQNTQSERDAEPVYTPDVENFLAEVNFGTVINLGNFSITYTQKPSTAYSKGLYSHNVGNISVYFSW